MKVMENDTDWQFVTIGDQVAHAFDLFFMYKIDNYNSCSQLRLWQIKLG